MNMSNGLTFTNQRILLILFIFLYKLEEISLFGFGIAMMSFFPRLLDLTIHLKDDIVKESGKTTRCLYQKRPVGVNDEERISIL